MELTDLHIFRTVARSGGITRAAAHLHRVPSNVTTRVRQLENELRVELFVRERKRLQLSPAGSVLLEYADRLLGLAEEAQHALHDTTPRGPFRLGSMESLAAVRLPGPLSEYHRTYPQVTLELRTGSTQPLLEQLLDGRLDAVLVAEPAADKRLEKIALFEEEMIIVAEAGHSRIASAQDVSTRSLLTFTSGCAYRKRLEQWFASDSVVPDRIVELSSYHAILGCALAGMGVALVPRSILDAFPGRKRLSIHALTGTHRKARIVMLWRKGKKNSNIQAMIDLLRAQRQITS